MNEKDGGSAFPHIVDPRGERKKGMTCAIIARSSRSAPRKPRPSSPASRLWKRNGARKR